MPKPKEYVKTKVELAAYLNTTRPTLDRLCKTPGAPHIGEGDQKFHLVSWREFYAKEVRRNNFPITPNTPSPELSAKARKETALARKAEREMEILDRDYLPLTEINESIDRANAIVMRELRKVFEHELPPSCEGMSAAEIRAENSRALDQVFEKLPSKFKK